MDKPPKHVLRGELIGLQAEVINSTNRYVKGISGKVVDETLSTIVIRTVDKDKRIMKKGSVFKITKNNEEYSINGDEIQKRSQDRIMLR